MDETAPVTTKDSHWWNYGACIQPAFKSDARALGAWRSPADVFFPIMSTDDDRPIRGKLPMKYKVRQMRFEQLARRTCGDCPVRQECLLDTITNETDSPHGFSGALTPNQRMDLLDGDDLVSTKCQGCAVTLWGTTSHKPPKICGASCG